MVLVVLHNPVVEAPRKAALQEGIGLVEHRIVEVEAPHIWERPQCQLLVLQYVTQINVGYVCTSYHTSYHIFAVVI